MDIKKEIAKLEVYMPASLPKRYCGTDLADSIISLIESPDSPYIKKSEVVIRLEGIEKKNPHSHQARLINIGKREGFKMKRFLFQMTFTCIIIWCPALPGAVVYQDFGTS